MYIVGGRQAVGSGTETRVYNAGGILLHREGVELEKSSVVGVAEWQLSVEQ